MASAAGDLAGSVAALKRELNRSRYPAVLDEDAVRNGEARALLPALHYALLGCSRHVTREVVACAPECAAAASDLRFIDAAYKALRHVLDYHPPLAPHQFLSKGFAERRVGVLLEVLSRVAELHNALAHDARATHAVGEGGSRTRRRAQVRRDLDDVPACSRTHSVPGGAVPTCITRHLGSDSSIVPPQTVPGVQRVAEDVCTEPEIGPVVLGGEVRSAPTDEKDPVYDLHAQADMPPTAQAERSPAAGTTPPQIVDSGGADSSATVHALRSEITALRAELVALHTAFREQAARTVILEGRVRFLEGEHGAFDAYRGSADIPSEHGHQGARQLKMAVPPPADPVVTSVSADLQGFFANVLHRKEQTLEFLRQP